MRPNIRLSKHGVGSLIGNIRYAIKLTPNPSAQTLFRNSSFLLCLRLPSITQLIPHDSPYHMTSTLHHTTPQNGNSSSQAGAAGNATNRRVSSYPVAQEASGPQVAVPLDMSDTASESSERSEPQVKPDGGHPRRRVKVGRSAHNSNLC